MKKKLIIALIYLSGCFVSYVYGKHTLIKQVPTAPWTKGDRFNTIALSTASWLNVIALGLLNATESMRADEPANW